MSVGTVPGEHDTFKGMLIVVDKKDEGTLPLIS